MRKFIWVIFSLILQIVSSQVLGIDFGTQYWKAALISPGKNLQIVQNSRSERKTLNAMAFEDGLTRLFQSQCLVRKTRKPQSAYFYLNRLIRSLDEKPFTNYRFKNETYIFTHNQIDMSLEQIVAMILKHLKYHASRQAGTDIKDCVITIPANWGPKAKNSLINSALLADLVVLEVVYENSAAMINFAISRNDTERINMVVFNLGSYNLQISVMKLWGFFDEQKNKTFQSLSSLSHLVINGVGGLTIDSHIADYLAGEFEKIHKVDPRSKERSFVKLLQRSSDAKEVLSANKEMKVYIEGLIDGIDLQIPLKRELIDKMEMFNKFSNYIQQALDKAGLSKEKIGFVELIGGCSRVPRVANLVKQFFGDIEVGAHMNGDEAMAFGSCLRAANLSIALRVKQLHFYEPNNFQIKTVISSIEAGVIHEELSFTNDDGHGSTKSIIINQTGQELKITLLIEEELIFKEYVTTNLTQWNQTLSNYVIDQQPYIVIHLFSSSISIAEIKDIFLLTRINVTNIKEVVEYVEEEIFVSQKHDQDENRSQKNVDQDQKERAQSHERENKTTKTLKTIKKKIQSVKTVARKVNINFEQIFTKYEGLKKGQVQQGKQILLMFEENEKKIKQRAKIRNEMESTLYAIKANFNQDILIQFSNPAELKLLTRIVLSEIQWLEENSFAATKEQIQSHYETVRKVYQPINNRTIQHRQREKTYNRTLNFVFLTYSKTQELNRTHAWLQEKIQKQLEKINTTVEWINNQLTQQNKRPLNHDPIFYNNQLVQLADALRAEYYLLKMIPKSKISKTQINTQNDREEAKQQNHQQNQEKENNEEDKETEDELDKADMQQMENDL